MSQNCLTDRNFDNSIKQDVLRFNGLTPQQKLIFFQNNGINIGIDLINRIDDECSNASAFASTNIISVSCNGLAESVCSGLSDYYTCVQRLKPKITNVSQVNKSENILTCSVNKYIELLKSINTPKATHLALSMKNIINNLSIDCNAYTDATYDNSSQICSNIALSDQLNELATCYGKNISQQNTFDMFGSCMADRNKSFITRNSTYLFFFLLLCSCIILTCSFSSMLLILTKY